jgi:hypothetical protein
MSAATMFRLFITGGTFDESAHKYTYYNKTHLVKIDGKPYYGAYDEKPETTIESVLVIVNKDTIPIPAAAYNDLFNPEFTIWINLELLNRLTVFICLATNTLFTYTC